MRPIINHAALFLLGLLFLCGCASIQYSSASPSKHIASKNDYERLKSLSGNWHLVSGTRLGKELGPNFEEPFLSYSVSSGGHSVIEKLFVGKPNEMITIYYLDAGQLMMDHYCSLGNQPRMAGVVTEENEIAFNLVSISNMASKNDLHISFHSLQLHNDTDELTMHWGATQDQKPAGGSVYKVKRAH
tara:strand:- start:7 stop:567 length:561 start_codon:yes stop_codon:yes gene_type:complete